MNKTKAFFANISERLGKLSLRKIIIAVFCAVCFLIPSFLALSIVFSDDSSYIPDSLSVELYDSERILIAEESAEPNLEKHNSLVDIFYHILTGSTPVAKPPISPDEAMPLYASVVFNGDRAEYVCYFSFLNGSSYYMHENGGIFLIKSDTAENFLSSVYAESLYSKAAPPKLFTNTGMSIVPSSASWFYRLYDDTYREALNYNITSDALTYEFSEIIDVSFEDEPDHCTARVFENGSLIYEGSRESLSKLMISSANALRITLDAKWNDSDGALFHGEVSYSFDAILRDRSEFSVNSDTLKEGGFIVLTCTNIKDISKIKFESEYAYTPFFCNNGNNVQALIPYPKSSSSHTFDFTVSYGASTKHFSVKLASTGKSSASLKEIEDIVHELSLKKSKNVYFQGNLSSPLNNAFSAGYSLGDTITPHNENDTFIAFGNEYLSKDIGQSVRSICSGKVLYLGYSDTLGNYIVVDHGLGLLSWYCHLSDFDTSVEKILAMGDSVGKSGNGKFTDKDGFLLFITLNENLLDPSVIMEQK